MRKTILMLLAMSGCTATPAHAEPTFPDRGRAAVVDAAHVLPLTAAAALNERVVAWDRRTGHQLAIVIVPDMQGLDVKTYGYQLGRAWGLGDKARNDGAILLLAMKERKVRIEVGTGLEPVLTDAATSVILADRVVPKLKAGDPAGAMSDGADAIMAVASAEVVRPAVETSGIDVSWLWLLGTIGTTVAGFIGWVVLEGRRRRRRFERRAEESRKRIEAAHREVELPFRASRAFSLPAVPIAAARTTSIPPAPPARRAFVPSPTPTPTLPAYDPPARRDDSSSASSWGWGSSDSGSSSSGSSDSSSFGGFDSGGGSFSGGGSDSSW